MSNLNNIKANIDAAIDAGLGIGGILAANHNNVLTETLFGAGRYTGFFYTASGDLSGLAPTGFFLWNGNDPSSLAPFVVRAAELNIDLQDLGEVLALLQAGDIITIKDVEGRFFQLVYQSHVSGVDGGANNIYDISVIGVASNSNYIYGPAETQTAGLGFITAGGGAAGGQVNTLQNGQGIVIDAADPVNPIVDMGGTIDEFVSISIDGSGGFAEFGFSMLDLPGNSGLWQLNAALHAWYLEDSAGTSRTDLISNPGDFKVNVLDNNGGDDKAINFDMGDLLPGFTLNVIDASTNDTAEITIEDLLFAVNMTQASGQENNFEISPEQWGFEVADPSGNRQSGIAAEASASSSSLQLNLTTDQNGDDLNHTLDMVGVDGRTKLSVSENAGAFPETGIEFRKDELRIITPNVDGGTALVGQVLELVNAGTGEVEFASMGALTTLYSGNGSLAGARAVDLNGNELTFTEGGNIIYFNNGRVGVGTPVFGGSRLGDSELQAPNIDLQTLNFKDTGQLTALAMFFTKVPGVGVDGYVTSFKNFIDDVNVLSVTGVGSTVFGAVGRQVESTLGLRNDFSGGEFRVFDVFNNDYDAGTPVAEAQGFVAIHGGGATPKTIGLWRYDTIAYTPIFTVSTSNQFTFQSGVNVNTDGFLTARNSIVISGGASQNILQMQVTGATTPYGGLAFPTLFWQNIGGDDIFFIARSGTPDASDDFGIDLVNLTNRRIGTVPDKDFTFGLDDDAIHDNVANEISAIPAKAVPVAGDLIIIEDSAAGFVKKSVDIANLPGGGGAVNLSWSSATQTVVNSAGTNAVIGQATSTLFGVIRDGSSNTLISTITPAPLTIGPTSYANVTLTGTMVAIQARMVQVNGTIGALALSIDFNFGAVIFPARPGLTISNVYGWAKIISGVTGIPNTVEIYGRIAGNAVLRLQGFDSATGGLFDFNGVVFNNAVIQFNISY